MISPHQKKSRVCFVHDGILLLSAVLGDPQSVCPWVSLTMIMDASKLYFSLLLFIYFVVQMTIGENWTRGRHIICFDLFLVPLQRQYIVEEIGAKMTFCLKCNG